MSVQVLDRPKIVKENPNKSILPDVNHESPPIGSKEIVEDKFENVPPSSVFYSLIEYHKLDIQPLIEKHQASMLEKRVIEALQRVGFEVVSSMHIVDENGIHRFVDIYLPKLDLAIEVDGFPYHNSEKSKLRDERKNAAIRGIGIRRIKRFLCKFPDYIYKYERDGSREIIWWKYEEFIENWIENLVQTVCRYHEVEKFKHSKYLKNMEKDIEENMQKNMKRLEELKNS
jgi:hypothetical protein